MGVGNWKEILGCTAAGLSVIAATIGLTVSLMSMPDITVVRQRDESLVIGPVGWPIASPLGAILVLVNDSATACTAAIKDPLTEQVLVHWLVGAEQTVKVEIEVLGALHLMCLERPEIRLQINVGDRDITIPDSQPLPTPTPTATLTTIPSSTTTPTPTETPTSIPPMPPTLTPTFTPTVTPTFTPVPYTTETTVDARGGWLDTGVYVEPGDEVTVESIGGSWTIYGYGSSYGNVGAEGYDSVDPYFYERCAICCSRVGSLIARVGDESPFEVGGGLTWIVGRSGTIILSINDHESCNFDNSGSVNVRITVVKAWMSP